MRTGILFLLWTGILLPQGHRMQADDIVRLPSQPPAAKFAYGAAPQQYAEVRLPEGKGPFPVVAIIHGGCWIEYATAQYTAHLATALTSVGFATWNLEYRRAHEEGGGWPGTFRDAEDGVNALATAAAKYPLDAGRVILMGHSAGGQLALMAAKRSKLALRGVVSLAGVVDMRAYAKHGLKDCAAGELRAMGGTPEEHPGRYAQVSPFELLPIPVPQVLVWGEQDTIVPGSLFAEYERRSRARVLRVANAGHHELCSAGGPGWQQIMEALKQLLQ